MAAASAAEAAKLGAELTPLGAEKAGNADGSIPAWDGGLTSAAQAGFANFRPGQHHPDPYANDKPLYTVTAANMGQYANKLTEGHKKLLQTYRQHIQDDRVSDASQCRVPATHLRRHQAHRHHRPARRRAAMA